MYPTIEYEPDPTLPLNGTFEVSPTDVTPGIADAFSASLCQNVRRAAASAYLVAGSDWELDAFGGYADAAWELDVRYALPTTILREAIEDRLRDRPEVTPPERRVHSPLAA